MRRANVQLKTDRRTEILEAARRCFARSGFHQASMQEICAEAGMSPGNLYRYFPSKEALIAGIAEGDRATARADFAAVSQAPDFFTGFAFLARQYLVERTTEEIGLCAEIMAESRRNPDIARIYAAIQTDVKNGLVGVLRDAAARGEIPSDIDFERVVVVLLSIGDGIEWRRAVDPSFDPEAVLPLILKMVRSLLSSGRDSDTSGDEENSR
jgi:AcrR family transcriptional regulator